MSDFISVDELVTFAQAVGAEHAGEEVLPAEPSRFGLRQFSLPRRAIDEFAPIVPDDLDEFRASLGLAAGRRENAVFMDTTTLTVVARLIADEEASLTPVTLLDLATFAANVVVYDRIFHFEAPSRVHESLNDALGDVFVPISVSEPPEPSGEFMYRLWYQTRSFIATLEQASDSQGLLGGELLALRNGWECILGRRIPLGELFEEPGAISWYSDAPSLVRQLVRETGMGVARENLLEHLVQASPEPPGDRRGLRDLISECNLRSYFNHQVSKTFGLPYAPNTARLPLRRHQYLRARAIQERLATVAYLEESYRKLAATYTSPTTGNLQLPVFLAAALAKVNSRSEILEALAELRNTAGAFRSHRAELDRAIQEGDIKTMRKVRDALETEDTRILRGLVGYGPSMGAIGAVLAATSSEPFVLSVGAALAVVCAGAQAVPDQVRAKLVRRLLQPEYWFLTDLAVSAKAMTNALPKIGRLWTISEQAQDRLARRFERVAELGYG